MSLDDKIIMKTKKIIASVLTSICGIIFIISAITKLFPVEPLEFTFADVGFIPWEISPFLARLLIGFELFLGVLLLLNLYLKKFTYRFAILTLIIFSGFLVYQFFTGNNENCGCFGEFFKMTPFQALIKNLLILGAIFYSSRFLNGWELKLIKGKVVPILVFLISCSLPFILNTIRLDYSKAYLNRPSEFFEFQLDTLYNNAQLGNPPKTLSKGKHVFAFLSLTCPHCKLAAKKIGIMHKRNPEIHFFLVFNGKMDDLKPFLNKTKTQNIEHDFLYAKSFVYMAGIQFPIIFLVNNGVVEHFLSYQELDQSQIEKWIETKKGE